MSMPSKKHPARPKDESQSQNETANGPQTYQLSNRNKHTDAPTNTASPTQIPTARHSSSSTTPSLLSDAHGLLHRWRAQGRFPTPVIRAGDSKVEGARSPLSAGLIVRTMRGSEGRGFVDEECVVDGSVSSGSEWWQAEERSPDLAGS
ncbi:hypothetical protein LTR28_002291 [Elasticomyces elasticus]|nr:hypothetical protein LTR28_002291 [Elasticomyces elasticus]